MSGNAAHDAYYAQYYAQYGTGAPAPAPADGSAAAASAVAASGAAGEAPAVVPDTVEALKAENGRLMAQNSALRSEAATLRAEVAQLKASAAHVPPPPPQFYPPPAYPGYPPQYSGYPGYPPYPAPAMQPPPAPAARLPTLSINSENKRGPKGANLAFFCLPNSWTDQQVYDLAKPYGNPIFCSVATHRDTGLSRGYAFVSFDSVEEANQARAALDSYVIEGRALRCELTKQDKDPHAGARPY